jgi:hypothetical protein
LLNKFEEERAYVLKRIDNWVKDARENSVPMTLEELHNELSD